jgi:hypothetical protein
MIIRYFKDYISFINEGLIKTHPGDIVSKNLSSLLIGLNLNFNVDFLKDDNKIRLTFNFFNAIPVSNLDSLFDIINSSVINKGGWFPSQMNITNIHGLKNYLKYDVNNLYLNHPQYNIVELIYESKFDESIDDIPNKLYHLSISEYKDKIVKCGLSPKSKDKLTTHLDRVYLCGDIEDCKNLINRMKLYYNDEKHFNVYNKQKRKYDKDTNPIIFEVDNSDNFIKKLYKDPNYENGFYTLENIPPDKLKIINING